MRLLDIEMEIVWAAMQAMVNDCHAPQDGLTSDQWEVAKELLARLDKRMNADRGAT